MGHHAHVHALGKERGGGSHALLLLPQLGYRLLPQSVQVRLRSLIGLPEDGDGLPLLVRLVLEHLYFLSLRVQLVLQYLHIVISGAQVVLELILQVLQVCLLHFQFLQVAARLGQSFSQQLVLFLELGNQFLLLLFGVVLDRVMFNL